MSGKKIPYYFKFYVNWTGIIITLIHYEYSLNQDSIDNKHTNTVVGSIGSYKNYRSEYVKKFLEQTNFVFCNPYELFHDCHRLFLNRWKSFQCCCKSFLNRCKSFHYHVNRFMIVRNRFDTVTNHFIIVTNYFTIVANHFIIMPIVLWML